jgi:hypothetical protein
MNITQETDGLDALLKAMEKKDKEVTIQPACNLDDDECLSCGS